METLVVTVKDKHEMQLVSDILKKMCINAKHLTKEEREDLGLSKLMKQANRSEKVSREQVMKLLSGE
jgi:glycine betaine/choline ABC-type transport system substrate-binding protein